MQEQNSQELESNISNFIRNILGSPQAEQDTKNHLIKMVSQNLHVPGVVASLFDALPTINDQETKGLLLDFLVNLGPSYSKGYSKFYDIQIEAFDQEQNRAVRVNLLRSLKKGIHDNPRIISFFESLIDRNLSEPEQLIILHSFALLPTIPENLLFSLLKVNVYASDVIQLQVVQLTDKCPTWTNRVTETLISYLDAKNSYQVRLEVLDKLASTQKLTKNHVSLLVDILCCDAEIELRCKALECIMYVRQWNSEVIASLLLLSLDSSTLTQDALPLVERSEYKSRQFINLVNIMRTDTGKNVRMAILKVLTPAMAQEAVRTIVSTAYANNPSSLTDKEFNLVIDVLEPYVEYDENLHKLLAQSVKNIPRLSQRVKILQMLVIPGRMEVNSKIGEVDKDLLLQKEEVEYALKLQCEESERLAKENQIETSQKEQYQKELMNSILHLEKKNELLIKLKEVITASDKADKKENNTKKLQKLIDENLDLDNDFEKFSKNFEIVYPNFFTKLIAAAQETLTQTDLRYCSYIYMGLTTKEISNLSNIDPGSVRTAKYRLKQKFSLGKSEDLKKFITNKL